MTTTGVDSEGFGEVHRRLLADPSLQFDLPTAKPEPPPAWLEPLLRFLREHGDAIRIGFYVLLAAAAVWLLWLVGRHLHARWLGRTPRVVQTAWRPEVAAARRLLEEADALAGEGRYGEMIALQRSRFRSRLAQGELKWTVTQGFMLGTLLCHLG